MPSLQTAIEQAIDLWKMEKLDPAARLLDTILQQAPNNPLALYLLGSIHLHKNAPGTAVILLEQAVREDPSADWAWHNLGIAHKQMQDTEKAEKCYRRALKIQPDRQDTMAMVAGCYVNTGNPEPAIEWADKALELDPTDPHAKNHKALALLEMGKWEEGWEYWMNRWEVPERQKMKRDYGCEQWRGGPVDGTIVVHGEQGLGDEILYMSCFDRFREEVGDCRIVIESATRLVSLFRRSFEVPVYGTEEEVKARETPDYFVSMGDLPARYLKSDEDFRNQPERYLRPDPERVKYWREKLGPVIGIAWWGGLAKTHSKARNAPMKYWKDLVQHGNFVSVQYETGDTEHEAEKIGVPHFPEAVADFDEHMALVDACDMIVTVCQTAHHMAGALGKPCRTLVPTARAFRYGEGQSIWYPSVVQCNQAGDDWGPAFEKVKQELSLTKAA